MKYAFISFTAHGEYRLRVRNIAEGEVRETLEHPQALYRNEGKLVAERFTDRGSTLRVVYIERTSEHGISARIISVVRIRGNRVKEERR